MLRKEIPRFGNKGVPEIGITLLIARIKILLTLGTTETKKTIVEDRKRNVPNRLL